MRSLGGFFIRRKLDRISDKKDILYRAAIQSYMCELLHQSQSVEFFIEGGRTRTGKACFPKLASCQSVWMLSWKVGIRTDLSLPYRASLSTV